MQGRIKVLKDVDKSNILPMTHAKVVYVDEKNTLDKTLNNIESQIAQHDLKNLKDGPNGSIIGINANPTEETGENSMVLGKDNTVTGGNSLVTGINNKVAGTRTIVVGQNNETKAAYNYVFGSDNFCEGYNNIMLMGAGLRATTGGQLILGNYNSPITSYRFYIGNGNSTDRRNIFGVTSAGETKANGSYSSTGADYAEITEWLDGNPNGEDRVGYFVQLINDKIKLADSKCKVFGVISTNPAIIGDSYYNEWHGKYVTDKWGRIQYEDVVIPAKYEKQFVGVDEEGNKQHKEVLIEEERKEIQPILSKDYDNTQEYIPREERKEFAPVGMVGKLLIKQDGTAKKGGKVLSNDKGIATDSLVGYDVLEVASDEIIRIAFHQEVWTQEQLRKLYDLIGTV